MPYSNFVLKLHFINFQIELKNKYKVRVFVDESYSFGVLGKRGCGVTDHFGIPVSEMRFLKTFLN